MISRIAVVLLLTACSLAWAEDAPLRDPLLREPLSLAEYPEFRIDPKTDPDIKATQMRFNAYLNQLPLYQEAAAKGKIPHLLVFASSRHLCQAALDLTDDTLERVEILRSRHKFLTQHLEIVQTTVVAQISSPQDLQEAIDETLAAERRFRKELRKWTDKKEK